MVREWIDAWRDDSAVGTFRGSLHMATGPETVDLIERIGQGLRDTIAQAVAERDQVWIEAQRGVHPRKGANDP